MDEVSEGTELRHGCKRQYNHKAAEAASQPMTEYFVMGKWVSDSIRGRPTQNRNQGPNHIVPWRVSYNSKDHSKAVCMCSH